MTTLQTLTDLPETNLWSWRGQSIPYLSMGTGRPLVLIHGFGATIGHWRKNIPTLAQAGYQVFALDLLGFGNASKPALDYTTDLWQAQLYDFWAEKIATPAVWVGNSIGGLLGLQMLADYPQASLGGVLLNCAGGINHRPEELNWPLRLVMGAFTQLVSSPWAGPLLFNLIRQRSRIRSTLKQVYYTREAITEELVEMLYQPSCDPGAQRVFASVLTAPPGRSPQELLPHIHQPLLILWGDQDPWTPIQGAKIYQELANGEFHPIPNTGHCPHDERPEIVNPLIIDWLARVLV